jgi:hypothetical protein
MALCGVVVEKLKAAMISRLVGILRPDPIIQLVGCKRAVASIGSIGEWERYGVFEDLLIGRATRSCFLLGGLPALVFHLSAVEAHARIVAEAVRESMSASPPITAAPNTRCRVR